MIALVAILELWLAFQVPEPSTFLVVGPRLFPYILGGALLLSAVLLFTLPAPRATAASNDPQRATEHADAAVVEDAALTAQARPPAPQTTEHTDAAIVDRMTDVGEEKDETLEWKRVLILMALTLVYVLAFEPLGFVLATVPFIIAAASVLGSKNWLRDIIVAVAVAVGIFYLFTQLLKVRLPGPPFDLF